MHLPDEVEGIVDLFNFEPGLPDEPENVAIPKSLDMANVIVLPAMDRNRPVAREQAVQRSGLSFQRDEEMQSPARPQHPQRLRHQ